jgi:hypothetical protein
MTKVSEKFLVRLKLHQLPGYRIAQMAGINPVTLSKLINGIEPLRPDDERIRRVGSIIGLKDSEVFENLNRI